MFLKTKTGIFPHRDKEGFSLSSIRPLVMFRKKKSIISVCTYRRPLILPRCLDSLFRQQIPEDWDAEILLVNNDPDCDLWKNLSGERTSSPMKIHYVVEPRAGIPHARNTACRESLKLGADWILFLDDDEEAEPGWLMAYRKASAVLDADVYTGPVRFLYPAGYAEWLENKGLWNLPYGKVLKRAATNNVMFKSELLKPPFDLLFDTRLEFSGGSDIDFFMTAAHKGATIRYVDDAVVSEVVAENRLRLSWRLYRQYASSASHIFSKCKLFGFKKTLIHSSQEVFRRISAGLLRLLCSPFYLLAGRGSFKRCCYHGFRHFAKAAGIVAGLLGRRPSPYKNFSGC